ncbi:hypothetical protein PBY51_001927 [Eleginops maclovinus]|uniref:Uncharacterized protein n=1 Tax=Eleginops maclovinus TaxID=56733 RepID=A0AAN8ADA8_ELEMC|nr:hypothetical protein PBY51_001927 [Eleginops maclovinus]
MKSGDEQKSPKLQKHYNPIIQVEAEITLTYTPTPRFTEFNGAVRLTVPLHAAASLTLTLGKNAQGPGALSGRVHSAGAIPCSQLGHH